MADSWPFQSVGVTHYTDADGHARIGVHGAIETVDSYLTAFGAAPAIDERTGERCIVRLDANNQWLVEPATGQFRFERPVTQITAGDDVRAALTGHEWQSVGWTIAPAVVSVDFSTDGQGFCRFGRWGFEELIGNVVDRYWTYRIAGTRLQIEWEDEGSQEIEFQIQQEFRAFSRRRGLGFTEVTLRLSAHPFPPSVATQVESWPREYWGTAKKDVGTR
jgi:hypothetical protein